MLFFGSFSSPVSSSRFFSKTSTTLRRFQQNRKIEFFSIQKRTFSKRTCEFFEGEKEFETSETKRHGKRNETKKKKKDLDFDIYEPPEVKKAFSREPMAEPTNSSQQQKSPFTSSPAPSSSKEAKIGEELWGFVEKIRKDMEEEARKRE